MSILVPCAGCGGNFIGQAEFEAHRCSDGISRKVQNLLPQRTQRIAKDEELLALGLKLSAAGTNLCNFAGSAVDEGLRFCLLGVAYVLLSAGKRLARWEAREIPVAAAQGQELKAEHGKGGQPPTKDDEPLGVAVERRREIVARVEAKEIARREAAEAKYPHGAWTVYDSRGGHA